MTDDTPDPSVLTHYPVASWPWPRIAVFVPLEKAWPHSDRLFPSFIQVAQCGVPFLWQPAGRTDVVRNEIAYALLESRFTHVLMLDSDQTHRGDIVQVMAKHIIDDPEKLIVGGVYHRRGVPYEPLAFNLTDDGRYESISLDDEPGLKEIDGFMGTGCMLINRRVFEILEPPWFWYDYSRATLPGERVWISEDVTFCLAAHKAGIRMYVDTSIDSQHAITSFVGRKTYESYWSMVEGKHDETEQTESE